MCEDTKMSLFAENLKHVQTHHMSHIDLSALKRITQCEICDGFGYFSDLQSLYNHAYENTIDIMCSHEFVAKGLVLES